MAIVVTERGTAVNANAVTGTSTTTTVTTGSFSPAGGALLLACFLGELNSGTFTVTSMTDTLSGTGSWSELVTVGWTEGAFADRVSLWGAVLGGSPGTGTVTATVSNSSNIARNMGLITVEVTGSQQTGLTNVGSNSMSGSTANLTVTLGSAPASTSLVLGFFFDTGDGTIDVTVNNLTETQEYYYGTASNKNVEWAQKNGSSPAQSNTWSASPFGTDSRGAVMIEIPIAATEPPMVQTTGLIVPGRSLTVRR